MLLTSASIDNIAPRTTPIILNKTKNTNLIEHLNSENLNKELLKKQMKYEKQKQTIKLLQQQIQSYNNTNEIDNLKGSIYEEISSLNNQ